MPRSRDGKNTSHVRRVLREALSDLKASRTVTLREYLRGQRSRSDSTHPTDISSKSAALR